MRKLPWVGDEHPVLDADLGHVEREHLAPARVGPRRGLAAAAVGRAVLDGEDGGAVVPGLGLGQRSAGGLQVLGAHAATAPDDLRALGPPVQGQLRVLGALDAGLLAPSGGREIAEVGVDAEREIGEVAQPREHAGDVIRGDAVDRQRAHPHLLKAPRRPAKGVTLRSAPMLAVDTAHAVAAAPEAQPHRDPGVEQRLDGGVGGAADQRQGLEQDEIRGLLLERAREQRDRLAAVGRVDVSVDAEGNRHLVGAAGVLRGRAGQADGAAHDVHPVDGLR